MDHVQIRVDDLVALRPDHSGEGRVVSVNLMCIWPSTATEDEIEQTLAAACDNARAEIKRKRDQAAA